MPFTFSHPAIVLPFSNSKRNILSLTGLIVGSVTPDFEFLLRLKETACFGHTWLGLFAFDIPFAILLSFVFHNIVRDTLILHLPKFLFQRFSALISFGWTNYFIQHKLKFFLSVLVGIFSHVFLDAFTHSDGFFTERITFFSKEIAFLNHTLPVYSILQLATSLLGALYILWMIFKMKKETEVQQNNNAFVYWLSLAIGTICIFAIRLLSSKRHESFEDIIIAIIGSFLYALVTISLYYSIGRNRLNKKSSNVLLEDL